MYNVCADSLTSWADNPSRQRYVDYIQFGAQVSCINSSIIQITNCKMLYVLLHNHDIDIYETANIF